MKLRRSRLAAIIVILSVLAGMGVVIGGYQLAYRNRIYPKVMVGIVAVGGLTVDEATKKLQTTLDTLGPLKITVDEKPQAALTATDLGISYDLPATVQAAWSVGRQGVWGHRLGSRLRAVVASTILNPIWSNPDEAIKKALNDKLFIPATDKVQEVSLQAAPDGSTSIIPGKAGMVLDEEQVFSEVRQQFARLSLVPLSLTRHSFSPRFTADDATEAVAQAKLMLAAPLTLTYPDGSIDLTIAQLATFVTATTAVIPGGKPVLAAAVNADTVNETIKTLAFDQINRTPNDAKIRFTDGKIEVYQPSQSGLTVDEAASAAKIGAALLQRAQGKEQAKIDLQVAVVAPAIDSTKLADMGIKELIGRASTDYATSPANRKHNIAVGAQKMSGTILKDGEEFSAVKALGVVDAAAGYLPELVISNKKLAKEYGGGLCQPITTLFRAVLDTGLPVTDRTNHSRRVVYYEKASKVPGVRINWDQSLANSGSNLVGYDATVYIPAPDLKFKNDTGHAILIQAVITNNNQVTFELYGTNDGRQVAVSKASITTLTSDAGPEFNPDPSQPSGTMQQVEKPVPGAKTSFTYTITYPDQHQVAQTFASVYQPIAGAYMVGTAEPVPVATPDPAATPAP